MRESGDIPQDVPEFFAQILLAGDQPGPVAQVLLVGGGQRSDLADQAEKGNEHRVGVGSCGLERF
ncbi:hypothetical protein GCM10020001_050050 [Nonomuraea salmonea]